MDISTHPVKGNLEFTSRLRQSQGYHRDVNIPAKETSNCNADARSSTQVKLGSPISKCSLELDGYSYLILASPPDKGIDSPCADSQEASKNGQLTNQGPLTIVRRSSSKTFNTKSRIRYEDELLDTLDLEADDLPLADATEAPEKAAIRLRALLRRLRKGEIPASALQSNLQYAAEVLENALVEELKRDGGSSFLNRAVTISLDRDATKKGKGAVVRTRRLPDDDDELSEVEPDAVPPEVREWLASTFTKQLQGGRKKTDEKPKFRSVANAIRAGIFVERIYRKLSTSTFIQLPPEVIRVLKRVDDWTFDIWLLSEISSTPLRCICYEFFNRYGLMHKFKIPPSIIEGFLQQMEAGYMKNRNPYHNNVHAADVMQTIHYMLSQTGILNWMSDLEVFATLLAALIHDFEHTGTTNNFHVMSGTDTAILYNDRAVLENHHISATFRILKLDEFNILVNLSREEFREFRSLVIDMVLATDMSSHFQQIKAMKAVLSQPEPVLDKSKSLSLLLHCCDISHPSKEWNTHEKWTKHLLEEFFRQGDKEKELGLSYSPLCDRNNTLVAQSQIGFIDFIVDPSMAVCGDLLQQIKVVLSKSNTGSKDESGKETVAKPPPKPVGEVPRPWTHCLTVNKSRWKERAARDEELIAELNKLQECDEEKERNETPTNTSVSPSLKHPIQEDPAEEEA